MYLSRWMDSLNKATNEYRSIRPCPLTDGGGRGDSCPKQSNLSGALYKANACNTVLDGSIMDHCYSNNSETVSSGSLALLTLAITLLEWHWAAFLYRLMGWAIWIFLKPFHYLWAAATPIFRWKNTIFKTLFLITLKLTLGNQRKWSEAASQASCSRIPSAMEASGIWLSILWRNMVSYKDPFSFYF